MYRRGKNTRFKAVSSLKWRDMLYLICFIVYLTVSGCQAYDEPGGGTDTGNDGLVTFEIKVPQTGTPESALPGTRALTDAQEGLVREVDVLVFAPSGGSFLYRAAAKTITANPETSTADYRFTAMLEETASCDIVIIANARTAVQDFLTAKGSIAFSKTDLQAGLCLTNSGKWDTQTPTPIPMWAEDMGRQVVKETVIKGIMLHRMLTRIQIKVAADNFDLREVYLYNAPSKGAVIPATASWDPTWKSTSAAPADPATGKATAVSMPAGWNRNTQPLVYTYLASEVQDKACTHEIYTFEAPAGDGSTGPDNTFLVIGGLYNGSTTVTYYRIDIAAQNSASQYEYLPLLRNHTYDFTVNSIARQGYQSADIACQAGPENTGVVLVVEHDEDLRYYVSDGHFYLAASEKIVRLPYSAAVWTTSMKIRSNYAAGWSVKASDSETDPDMTCSWITLHTALPSTGQELSYTVGVNDGWAVRRAYLHISAGIEIVITIEQESQGGVELPTVSPTGNIPSAGQTRTVTITGMFTSGIPVRVRDKYDSQAIDSNTVPANSPGGLPSSATLILPEWADEEARWLVFEYQDPGNSRWSIFHEDIQEGFNYEITTDLPEGGDLPKKPGTSQDPTVTVSGSAWPGIRIRAIDLGSLEVITDPLSVPAGNDGISRTVTLPVQAYSQWEDQPSRTVGLQWSVDGNAWTTFRTATQQGFFRIDGIIHKIYHPGTNERNNISHDGARILVTVSGDFDDGVVEVRLGPSAVQVDRVVDWVSANTATELYCRYNRTILPRSIPISYRKNINNGWENWTYEQTNNSTGNIATYVQPSIAFEMPETGRILAREDCTHAYTQLTTPYMSWSVAMGIDGNYNGENYNYDHTSGYPTYDISNGGCAAYYEGSDPNDAVRGQGKWYLWGDGRNEYTGEAQLFRLPRSQERDTALGLEIGTEYWTFMPGYNPTYMSTVQILENKWSIEYKYKPTAMTYVNYNPPYFIKTRCVRFPSAGEQQQIDNGGYAPDVITTY